MKPKTRDLTQGNLWINILLVGIPLAAANILQVLFNMVDIAVVGRFCGATALGSVGSTSTLIVLFTDFLIGLSVGTNVVTAIFLGAANREKVQDSVHTAFLIHFVIGVIIMLIGLIFARPILLAMHTKEDLIDGAVLYLRLYFLGMPALSVYNFGNAIFSAAGSTVKSLMALVASGVMNVILNLTFVLGFGMDVDGVAIASTAAQFIAAGIVITMLMRSKEAIAFDLKNILKPDGEIAGRMMRIGIPAGIQNAIFQFANLFIQRGVNSFSSVVVAGNAAAQNEDGIVYSAMLGFYNACSSFMGQNLGAGNKKRVRNSYLICLTYGFLAGLIPGVGIYIVGRQFLALFTGSAQVIDAGMERLRIMSWSYPVSAFMDCTIAASRSLGASVFPTVMVFMGSCVFRLIWIFTVFAYFGTITSLYLLYVFSWTITATGQIIYFITVYRRILPGKGSGEIHTA